MVQNTVRYRRLPPVFFSLLDSYREYLREPAAEFLGVMILIIFGNGVDCQVVLSANTTVASSPKGVSLLLNVSGTLADQIQIPGLSLAQLRVGCW